LPSSSVDKSVKNLITSPVFGLFFFIEKYWENRYNVIVSPTVFRYKNYRFLFFSREEARCHIHVVSPDGEAKFWVVPEVKLVENFGFSKRQITELTKIVKGHRDDIENSWKKHFKS
jgi:hypothetical protein